MLVAMAEMYARRIGVEPAQLWAWLDKREPIPLDVRDRLVAAFFPMVPPDSFLAAEAPLSFSGDSGTITTPMQLDSNQQKKVRGAVPTKHPFAAALRKRGMSLAEWAKANGVSPSYARSWIQRGVGGRPIPKKHAESIEREFGVPNTPATWKNGATK